MCSLLSQIHKYQQFFASDSNQLIYDSQLVALDTTTDAPSTPPRLRLLLLRAALFLLIFLFFAWIALCRWELLLALSDPRFIVFELLSLFIRVWAGIKVFIADYLKKFWKRKI